MRVLIFGATGVIGQKTISYIKNNKKLNLVGFSFYKNSQLALNIKKDFPKLKIYSIYNSELNNVNSYQELIEKTKPDIIVNSVIGFDGLELSLLAIKNKIDLALANKETIVLAGKFIFKLAKKNNVNIFPIDSEHTSLYSLIKSETKKISKIYITASGGKFYNDGLENKNPSFKEATFHPVWNMGEKISIDSSTMINKFFEIIEAYYFYNVEKIEALYHKEVLAHSLIEFEDGSINLNMYDPDMMWSIQQALSKFNSNESIVKKIDMTKLSLNFEIIDDKKWIAIKWANDFLKTKNNIIPIIVNCANDYCFKLFKESKIKFKDILKIIEKSLNKFNNETVLNIKDIYKINIMIIEYINGII